MEQPKITVYGAPWCPDCRQSKQFLGEQRVPYNWVDIDEDEEGRKRVQELNDGKQIIPTIIFEDGSILVEPSNAELAAKLGISPKAKREYYDLDRRRPQDNLYRVGGRVLFQCHIAGARHPVPAVERSRRGRPDRRRHPFLRHLRRPIL